MSIGWNLEKAVPILEAFDADFCQCDDINRAMELYNIDLIFKSGVRLTKWDDETYARYQSIVERLPRAYTQYFNMICDDNIKDILSNIDLSYIDDFWALFDKLKIYKKVSGEHIAAYIQTDRTSLHSILQNKNIVKYYDNLIANVLRQSDRTAELLISEFLKEKRSSTCLYFPSSFYPSEFEGVLQAYVDSGLANPNLLNLITNSQNSKVCPISDKLRLLAKRAYQKYWENNKSSVLWFNYGISVSFKDSDEIKRLEKDTEHNYIGVVFDCNWISENLDYPTLLNNFIYLFEYFDFQWRSGFISHKHRRKDLIDNFKTIGVKYYNKSLTFDYISSLFSIEMRGYCELLQSHGIRIENIFKWFFEEYLSAEFGATGFLFNPPTERSTALEKCKTLVSEIEGILKQFKYYVEDGCIDRELLEISSNPFPISTLKSFVVNKYAYANSKEIEKEMYLLFSNQCFLSLLRDNSESHSSLTEHLTHGQLRMSDFEHFDHPDLEWLLSRKSLRLNNDVIEMNIDRINILKDLYENDVICCSYIGCLRSQLDELVQDEDLRYGSTLLSEPEQDYFNYVLNKSKFSNGLDLRNKYIHSTYPADESMHKQNYLEFLKIMVLIIGKINEEFILRDILEKE